MQRLTLAKRLWLLLLLAISTVYFYGLGTPALVGPDEPRYAQVAREMFSRGDPVTPTLAGHTWFEKPALLYWMMMAGYRLFGVSEFAARFGAACSGLLTVLLVAALARRVERHAAAEEEGQAAGGFALTAVGVMASSAGLLVFSRGASFDIVLTMTVAAALACFFLSEIEERGGAARRRRLWLAGFYASIGLSLLAKGLVGIIIPCGVVGLYFVLRRRWPGLLRLGVLWGAALACGIAALWYAPVLARHGWTFVDEFFVQHHFARYVSDKYHHRQPFYFYVPILALLALPWTAFLVDAVGSMRHWRWRADDPASRLRLFALAWTIVPVAFFSLSGSKLPGYILPALPGAALLVSDRLYGFTRGEGGRVAMRATGVLALLFAVASPFVAYFARVVPISCALLIALPSAGAGVFILWRTNERKMCVAALVAAMFLTVMLITVCGLNEVANRDSVRALLLRADAQGYGALPVLQLHTVERTAEFYAAGRLAYDARGEPIKFEGTSDVISAARRLGRGRALVFVPLELLYQLTDDPRIESQFVGDNEGVALVFVRVRDE